jgi:hypothetical protein
MDQPSPLSKSLANSITTFARSQVLDALVPITLQMARQRVSLCQPFHTAATMDPRIWRFHARNLLFYAIAYSFAAFLSPERMLSLLPAIVASAICVTVPALGLFLEEGDNSVFLLYIYWSGLSMYIFPQLRMFSTLESTHHSTWLTNGSIQSSNSTPNTSFHSNHS